MELKSEIHSGIVKNLKNICDWFSKSRQGLSFPIYSSFDIRDSSYKIANVDANIFPAGFNNICDVDREHAPPLVDKYFDCCVDGNAQKIALLTEEHTNNPYYWENINALKTIFERAGKTVKLAWPKDNSEPFQVQTASGVSLKVYSAQRKGDYIEVDGMRPELIVSNNDFSESYSEWSKGLKIPINPPREMGWYRRKKSDYFREYNAVMGDFSKTIGIDSWHLQVETELFEHFDVSDEKLMSDLADQVDEMAERVRQKNREHKINEEPFIFVKNNSGTYGLGVIQVKSGADIKALNYKSRKKMKAAKGGREISEVIIQEGIPTSMVSSGATAEPTIYMMGCELLGGFLRTHSEKGPHDSLNSPGAVYKRLCVSDLEIDVQGKPLENVYGWIAKLGLLAIGREYDQFLKSTKG